MGERRLRNHDDVHGLQAQVGVYVGFLEGCFQPSNAAARIAKAAGIEEVRSDCLPEDKLSAIEAFEAAGQPVCMVGDGINDAPALKRATVGIAMGQTGSDIAVDAADIALVPHPSFRFSKGGRENRPATEYFSRAI